jgi:hypothetical protein
MDIRVTATDLEVGVRGNVEGELFLIIDSTLTATFDRVRLDTNLSPEKRLQFAVLKDALWTFAEKRKRHAAQNDVREWIFGEGIPGWPFSFESICEVFDISASHLRNLCREYDAKAYRQKHKRAA